MYKPVKDGIEKDVKSVIYTEAYPSSEFSELVHCFWEIKTTSSTPRDFLYHIIPDACVNILFNQIETSVTAITALELNSKTLNLGREFHYVGIQLLPGVWRDSPDEIVRGFVGKPYKGKLPLVETNELMVSLDFFEKQQYLSNLVGALIDNGLVAPNIVTSRILRVLDQIRTVADMAEVVGLSSRQLQRTLKDTTGFSPHDFLKILKLQQSFENNYLDYYADQAHYIHSFRKITGFTPSKYTKKFNV
ncbi:MAG: helix-turn-helix transcriptional regulator [Xanthomonadaceae bacterium]|nr:helix-turn-helix transcriptional regulator [Xanthomonadaceae bacterium]